MSKYLPHCVECGTSKAILTPISATLNREYLCQDCWGIINAPLVQQIERSATDGEVEGAIPSWSTTSSRTYAKKLNFRIHVHHK